MSLASFNEYIKHNVQMVYAVTHCTIVVARDTSCQCRNYQQSMCRLCVCDIDLVNERNKGEWADLEGILNCNHQPMISTLLGMIEIMVITFKW